MTTAEIGKEVATLCRQGKNQEAIDRFYSSIIGSVEACAMPGMDQTQRGIQAIKGKNQWWADNHEIQGGTVEGPFPNGDRFILRFKYDVTPKQTGKTHDARRNRSLHSARWQDHQRGVFLRNVENHHQPNNRRQPWQPNSTSSSDVWMCNRRAAADSRCERRRRRN